MPTMAPLDFSFVPKYDMVKLGVQNFNFKND